MGRDLPKWGGGETPLTTSELGGPRGEPGDVMASRTSSFGSSLLPRSRKFALVPGRLLPKRIQNLAIRLQLNLKHKLPDRVEE